MRIWIIAYTFLFLLLIFGCKREALHGSDKNFAGNYNWIYTSGGFAPTSETPTSTGFTRQLQICKNGRYTLNKNNKKEFEGPMFKDNDGFLTFTQGAIKTDANFLEGYIISRHFGDTIILDCKNCSDAYYYAFVKR